MFGYGPFEPLVNDEPSTGRPIPRWARIALFGPWVLVLAWAMTAIFGVSPPWLFWAVMGSLVLGYGSVLIACVYHVSIAWVKKVLPRGRRPGA